MDMYKVIAHKLQAVGYYHFSIHIDIRGAKTTVSVAMLEAESKAYTIGVGDGEYTIEEAAIKICKDVVIREAEEDAAYERMKLDEDQGNNQSASA